MAQTQIPQPGDTYDRNWAAEFKRQVDALAQRVHSRDNDVELGDGRIIAKSPNGKRFRITVDDDGNLISQEIIDVPVGTPPPPPPPPVPQAPVNAVPAGQSVLQASTLTFSTANGNAIQVADGDSTNLRTTLTVTAGTLQATTGGGATITTNGTANVVIQGTAAQINAALQGLVYTAPGAAQAVTLQVTTQDDGVPPLSDSDAVPLTVTAAPPPVGTAPFYEFASRKDLVNGRYPNGIVVSHKTTTEMDASIRAKYAQWKANNVVNDPVTPGGKAVWFSPTVLTRSEVMGYGMLLAVIMNDQVLFDQLLRCVRNHPAYSVTQSAGASVGNYLMDWSIYTDGSSEGGGWNALDGDQDIAQALVMADRQWKNTGTTYNYIQEATNTINAMKAWNVRSNGNIWSAGAGHVSRTSDYMLGHFWDWAEVVDKTFWGTTVSNRCAELIELMQSQYSSVGALMPDCIINIDGSYDPSRGPYPSPGTGFLDPHAPTTEGFYAYNGQRNPFRWAHALIWRNDARWMSILEKLNVWAKNKAGGNPYALEIYYRLDGSGGGQPWPSRAMVAGFMCGGLVNANHQSWVNACWDYCEAMWTLEPFTAELMLMGMIMASGNWWNRVRPGTTLPPAPPPPAPTPAPPSGDGLPGKILLGYYPGWEWEARRVASIDQVSNNYDVICLFNAQKTNEVGGLRVPDWGVTASQVQAARAKFKVLLTLGGAGNSVAINSRTIANNVLASVDSEYTRFGGFDGVDFNTFEGTTATSAAEMIYIGQQLKQRYGNAFIITAPPQPNEPADRAMLKAMADAGVLTFCMPQYYDWIGFNEAGFIRTRNRDWANDLGASRVTIGVTTNNYTGTGPSLQDTLREWDAIVQEYPSQRGVGGWNIYFDSIDGYQWSNAIRQRLGPKGGTPPPPPPPPAPTPPPPGDAPTIATLRHPTDWLLTGAPNMSSSLRGYYIEDNRWGGSGITEGAASNQFMQEVGRTLVVDGSPIAARFRSRWPNITQNEVKGFPSIHFGCRPGYRSPDHKPGWDKTIKLPDGGTDSVDKYGGTSEQAGGGTISDLSLAGIGDGRSPGGFLPLQLPLTGSIWCEFDWKHNIQPTGQGHLTFDIWLTRISDMGLGFTASPITHEIMIPVCIWGNYGKHGVNGGANPAWYDREVNSFQGRNYWLYCTKDSGRNDRTGQWDGGQYPGLRYNFMDLNGSHTNPETGQGAVGWKMIAYKDKAVPESDAGQNQSGHCRIDLAPYLNHLRTLYDSRGVPWLSGNEYLQTIEIGVEPIHGEMDMTLWNFSITRG